MHPDLQEILHNITTRLAKLEKKREPINEALIREWFNLHPDEPYSTKFELTLFEMIKFARWIERRSIE